MHPIGRLRTNHDIQQLCAVLQTKQRWLAFRLTSAAQIIALAFTVEYLTRRYFDRTI